MNEIKKKVRWFPEVGGWFVPRTTKTGALTRGGACLCEGLQLYGKFMQKVHAVDEEGHERIFRVCRWSFEPVGEEKK